MIKFSSTQELVYMANDVVLIVDAVLGVFSEPKNGRRPDAGGIAINI